LWRWVYEPGKTTIGHADSQILALNISSHNFPGCVLSTSHIFAHFTTNATGGQRTIHLELALACWEAIIKLAG
jgi:hypothetical protein